MKRAILFVLGIVFFSFSLFAVDVSLVKTDYARGENVVVSVDACVGASTLKITNPAVPADLVYVDQGNDVWQSSYNTNSNAFKGKYTVYVACADGTKSQTQFCVESPGCLGVVPVNDGGNNNPNNGGNDGPAQAGSSSGGSGGGSPRGRCNPQWQCDTYWSQCNADMTQSRNCVDTSRCAPPKLENRSCAPCQESWACSSWNTCEGGMESRSCYDDKDCGTATYKPVEERPCGVDIGGYEPDRYTSQVPPPSQAAPSRVQYSAVQKINTPVPTTTFWDEWGFLILALIALLLLVGLILFLLHLRHSKHPTYNSDELKVWMLKEREAGSTDGEIRQILMEQTGWTKEDVDLAFEELAKGQNSSAHENSSRDAVLGSTGPVVPSEKDSEKK